MRFAVMTDTHFFAGRDGVWWNRVLASRWLELGRCLVETLLPFSPDFVIHCGDLIGTGSLRDWNAAVAIMEQMGCPWYGAIGNHETWNPGVRAAFSEYFGSPHERCYYAVTLAGLRFMFLDTCHWRSTDGTCAAYLDKASFDAGRIDGLAVPGEELEWFASELEAARGWPVCLVSHAPLGFKPLYPAATLPRGRPAPLGGTPLEQFNDRIGRCGDIVNRGEVRALLAQHHHVRAAFAGHVHIHDFHRENGIGFCMTGALREYPFEFRLVEVEPAEDGPVLRVTTHGLCDSRYAEESLVTQWHNHWVAGTQSDRTFFIPMSAVPPARPLGETVPGNRSITYTRIPRM